MKRTFGSFFVIALMLVTAAHADIKFKGSEDGIKKSAVRPPSKSAIVGTYTTETETDWNADIKLESGGKLTVKVIAQSEDDDQPTENSRSGSWEIKGDKLILKFDKGWIHYHFHPASQVDWISNKVDLLVPISFSKDNLLENQVLYRRPFVRKSDR
jgi:hypothetical protein